METKEKKKRCIKNYGRNGLMVMNLMSHGKEEKSERIAERWTGIGWREIEFQRLIKDDRFRLRGPPGNKLWKWKGQRSWICSEKARWEKKLQTWTVKVKDWRKNVEGK